jgi:hypothetical protein
MSKQTELKLKKDVTAVPIFKKPNFIKASNFSAKKSQATGFDPARFKTQHKG